MSTSIPPAAVNCDIATWIDAFTTSMKLIRRWTAEQQRTDSILAALLEFHGRLLLLESGSTSGTAAKEVLEAAAPGEALPLLHARHVRGLENLLAALQTSARKFEAIQMDMSEVYAEVRQRCGIVEGDSSSTLVREDCVDRAQQPTWGLVGAGRGLDAQRVGLPPPAVCVQWVRELDQQFAAEMLLKLELLDAVDLGMSADALHGIHQLWTMQPHLRPETLERTAALADSLKLGGS